MTTPAPAAEPAAEPTPTAATPTSADAPVRLPDDHPLVKAFAATKTELADARTKIRGFEDADKSDLERANARVTEVETELAGMPAKSAAAVRSALVNLGVVSKEDEVLLTASTADELVAQVKRLADLGTARKKTNNVVPKEGATPAAAPSDERAFVRELFAGG